MIVLLLAVLLALFAPVAAHATCTDTPSLLLCKPGATDTDWLTRFNVNFDKLDTAYGAVKGVTNGQHYGAKGDGATNDSPAVQSLIDLLNSGAGGKAFLPCGTYLLNTGLIQRSNVHIEGNGWCTVLKVNSNGISGFGPGIRTVGAGVGITSNISIRNLRIDGNKAAFSAVGIEKQQSNIDWDQVVGGVIENVWSHDAVENGAYISNSSSVIAVRNSRFENNGKSGASGGRCIDFNISPTDFLIEGNFCTGSLNDGILVQAEGGMHAERFVIRGNDVTANAAHGIDLADSATSGSAGQDIYIRRGLVAKNIVQGNSGVGIRASEAGSINGSGKISIIEGVAIENNIVQGNASHGILATQINDGQLRSNSITGNTVQGNGDWGIIVSAATAAKITDTWIQGNFVSGNASGAISDNGTRTTLGLNKINLTSLYPSIGGLEFSCRTLANLGTPPNGTLQCCSDCAPNTSPCTGSSTGAFAKRLNGAFDCR